MKKMNNKGFMLAETLIVTMFVAGVLIYMFIQYSNLSKNYAMAYEYNEVEKLYALEDIIDYILSDELALNDIKTEIKNSSYVDITDCDLFTSKNYCKKLFELENVDKVIITTNDVDKNKFNNLNQKFIDFVGKIKEEGNEAYRIVASFKDSKFATIRFDENALNT